MTQVLVFVGPKDMVGSLLGYSVRASDPARREAICRAVSADLSDVWELSDGDGELADELFADAYEQVVGYRIAMAKTRLGVVLSTLLPHMLVAATWWHDLRMARRYRECEDFINDVERQIRGSTHGEVCSYFARVDLK